MKDWRGRRSRRSRRGRRSRSSRRSRRRGRRSSSRRADVPLASGGKLLRQNKGEV